MPIFKSNFSHNFLHKKIIFFLKNHSTLSYKKGQYIVTFSLLKWPRGHFANPPSPLVVRRGHFANPPSPLADHARAPRGPKVRGVSDLKSSKNLPLKYENSLFIAFLYYNFKKSGGSADPSDPVLAGPLNGIDNIFQTYLRVLWLHFRCF